MKLLVLFLGLISLSFGQDKRKGSLAMPNEFPYQAGLRISKIITDENNELQTILAWCSGTLVRYKIVVTAASCLRKAVSATILLGTYDLHSSETSRKTFTVDSRNWIHHSDYNPVDNSADIAIIRLPEAILFDEAIAPLHVINNIFDESNIVGRTATTSGWGNIGGGMESNSQIYFSNLKILRSETCEQVYNLKGKIPLFDAKNHFCVDGSICPEDVGSPLVVVDNIGTPTLIGIASFGNKNGCNKGMPTLFTRISSYLDWFNIAVDIEISVIP